MKITDEGRKVCEAINLSITQGEMLIYNQGIVDGLKIFKQMMVENSDLTTGDFIQVIDIFINDHTKNGMATEDTFVAPEEENTEDTSNDNTESSPENEENIVSEVDDSPEVSKEASSDDEKEVMVDAMNKITDAFDGNPLGALFGSMLSSTSEDLANSVKEQLADTIE